MNSLTAQTNVWDAIVVGSGPTGMNAALVLGRCRRSVLLFDDAKPRNAVSHALHGFLSRDGIAPAQLRSIAREQLAAYSSVVVDEARVVDAAVMDTGFSVTASDGRTFRSRKLLLAVGVVDELPEQLGFRELYGAGLFHCPYCDGWEMREQPLAVYGRGDVKGGGLAREMTQWTHDLVLCTDGPSQLSQDCLQRLDPNSFSVREERITRLEIASSGPHHASFDVVFETGARLHRTAIFFNTGRHQSTDLAARLGCDTYQTERIQRDGRLRWHLRRASSRLAKKAAKAKVLPIRPRPQRLRQLAKRVAHAADKRGRPMPGLQMHERALQS